MKYRTQSATVLNEADEFGRKLEWQLFSSEQDQQLFGYNESVEWKPGDPILEYPRGVRVENADGEIVEEIQGNYPRQMFDIFDDGSHFSTMRCKDCLVNWRGSGPCWVCGKEDERIFSKSLLYQELNTYSPVVSRITSISSSELGVSLVAQIEEDFTVRMEELYRRWARNFEDLSLNVSQAFRNIQIATPRVAGFSTDHVSIDVPIGILSRPGVTRLEELSPDPTNPFETQEAEIELVAEIAPDVSGPVYGGPRPDVPRDIDLSGRREVPLPQTQERDYTEMRLESTHWQQIFENERRRR